MEPSPRTPSGEPPTIGGFGEADVAMVMLQLNLVRQIAEAEEFERAVALASDADVTVVLIGTTEEVFNERDEAVWRMSASLIEEAHRASRKVGICVLTPTYPGFEGEVEALREDPSPIEALTVPAIIEHIGGIIEELDSPPIIMGHSAGGLLTQILLDHGYGAAGVAIDSVPAEGVKVVPISQIRATFPILKNPANRHKAVGFTKEQFHYAFTNTLSREDSDKVYERYHIPASGRLVWAGPLANFTPGHQETYVNFKNEDRAPLLFIGGSEDNIMPPAVNQSNVKHYRHAKSPTDYKEFEGRSHYSVIGGEGWEEVADYALQWAQEHATTRPAA